jgi:parallel beta-helix repeat protein
MSLLNEAHFIKGAYRMGKFENLIKPSPGMVITESVNLFPGVYNFYEKPGIKVKGNNIKINGNGCVILGGKPKKTGTDNLSPEEFSYGYGNMKDDSLGFYGIGMEFENCRNVELENVVIKGFEIGLKMSNSHQCKIHNNDFSYNYSNSGWGWDEHLDLGGIIMDCCNHNELYLNKANNLWSGLVLKKCNNNSIYDNDFSHTSNVGLKMWLSSYNSFERNNFSWGLRIEPNEVHARDSACVLIESASNHNTFKKNDMRYGGDGLFIRSLNNMMSMYNLFEENDTSFANNNAIEAWDAYNTFIRNKVNNSSYGFWLGCSDHTKLIENEIMYNGHIFRNAPEAFGNAGLAVVNGSGIDFIVKGNNISYNSGPGIAIRYKSDNPSMNWIIRNNFITNNENDDRGYKGYGVYLKNATNINFINNHFAENGDADVYEDENVSRVNYFKGTENTSPLTIHSCESVYVINKEYEFEVTEDCNSYEWRLENGDSYFTKKVKLKFTEVGLYRITVNGYKNDSVSIGYLTIYAAYDEKFIDISEEKYWKSKQEKASINKDAVSTVSGKGSMLLDFNNSKEAEYIWHPMDGLGLYFDRVTHMSYFMRYLNDFIDWEKEIHCPIITLYETDTVYMRIIPKYSVPIYHSSNFNEAKYEWFQEDADLYESDRYHIETIGKFKTVNYMSFYFNTPKESNLFVRLDGIQFIKKEEKGLPILRGNEVANDIIRQSITCSSNIEKIDTIFKPSNYQYENSLRWVSKRGNSQEFIQIKFDQKININEVFIQFYISNNKNEEQLPLQIKIFNQENECISVMNEITKSQVRIGIIVNNISELKILFDKYPLSKIGIINLQAFSCEFVGNKGAYLINTTKEEKVNLTQVVLKLNVEKNPKTSCLSNLITEIYKTNMDNIKTSNLIYKCETESNLVKIGKETVIDIDSLQLSANSPYHIALTQNNLAEGVKNGAYYRWCGSGISEIDGTYGYINQDGVINSKQTGWGRNYIKYIFKELVVDNSTKADNLGNRFGLNKYEKIYQIFKTPHSLNSVLIPNAFKIIKVLLHEDLGFSIKLVNKVQKLKFYLSSDCAAEIKVNDKLGQQLGNVVHFDNLNKTDILNVNIKKTDNSLLYISIIK